MGIQDGRICPITFHYVDGGLVLAKKGKTCVRGSTKSSMITIDKLSRFMCVTSRTLFIFCRTAKINMTCHTFTPNYVTGIEAGDFLPQVRRGYE